MIQKASINNTSWFIWMFLFCCSWCKLVVVYCLERKRYEAAICLMLLQVTYYIVNTYFTPLAVI